MSISIEATIGELDIATAINDEDISLPEVLLRLHGFGYSGEWGEWAEHTAQEAKYMTTADREKLAKMARFLLNTFAEE